MTKKQLEQRNREIETELKALRNRVQLLETAHAIRNTPGGAARRRPLPKRHVLRWLTAVGGVALISGLVFAQTGDAFYIDERGNVGIGTPEPRTKLDVRGPLRVDSLQIGNTIVGERELQILDKLAQGQLQVDIFNVKQGEFLYAADFNPYDDDRRYVFTWRRKDRINQGQWILRFPQ